MTDITIPARAIEAAAIEMAPAPWSMYTEDAKEHFRSKARAACLAMLAAWPGTEKSSPDPWSLSDRLILPITEADSD